MRRTVAKLFLLTFILVTATAGGAAAKGYEPAPAAKIQETVFVNHLDVGDSVYVEIDPIQWYEGEQANEIFREREGDAEMTEAPDGYYIVNDEADTEKLQIADDAKIIFQIYDKTGRMEDTDINWNEQVTLETLKKAFSSSDVLDMTAFPYHITIQDGKIVEIVQQFIP
ncbi:hypothetical protein OIN60_11415 [Paenibacillus sp. P96]|uniref:Uncharacterized protein n=1 Tax=Paenibacillus zeirhizosphaerae TaxID=2987519 RepID=A0ABT9FRP7_9BACL|nr:hypothetical protein [Paenibacillus sp. P96]MDP4097378.1 hypothetical protein [Paenibacillus sp. P96]